MAATRLHSATREHLATNRELDWVLKSSHAPRSTGNDTSKARPTTAPILKSPANIQAAMFCAALLVRRVMHIMTSNAMARVRQQTAVIRRFGGSSYACMSLIPQVIRSSPRMPTNSTYVPTRTTNRGVHEVHDSAAGRSWRTRNQQSSTCLNHRRCRVTEKGYYAFITSYPFTVEWNLRTRTITFTMKFLTSVYSQREPRHVC